MIYTVTDERLQRALKLINNQKDQGKKEYAAFILEELGFNVVYGLESEEIDVIPRKV